MPELTVGLDVGSSAVKVVVFDADRLEVVHAGSAPYERAFAAGGRVEVDPEHLWRAVVEALRALPADVVRDVVALAPTGQMCSIVCLDEERRPLGRCISIFDTRAGVQAERLDAEHGDRILAREANRPLSIHSLPKLLWLAEHEPDRLAGTRRVAMVKDWVRARLTGAWATEPSDASGTLAYAQADGAWDAELLEAVGLSADLWEDLVPSHAVAGAVTPEAARATGLPAGLPVVTGCADMAAVLVGAGAADPDDLVVSLGTAAHLIAPVEAVDPAAWPVQQYAHAIPGRHYRFGAVFSGGLSLEWQLRATGGSWDAEPFAPVDWATLVDGPLFMPYLTGAGAPHHVPAAAGALMGLRPEHGAPELAQAVLAGVALEVAGVRRSLDPEQVRGNVRVTGGASRVRPLVTLLACALEQPVSVTPWADATAVGAAVLARMGVAEGDDLPAALPAAAGARVEPSGDGVAACRRLRERYAPAAAAVREVRL